MTTEKITVNVYGTQSAIDTLNASEIKGYVDCSGLAAGEGQNVVLQFENPEGITVQNTSVTVDVVEEKKEDSEEEAEN